MIKLKKSKCDKTQNMTKLKNSKSDKTILKNVTKLKFDKLKMRPNKKKCDKTPKLEM